MFWYSDGSVVLSVADTLFKLHRSRLASQSTYLQDLFDGAPDEDYDADGQTSPLYVVRVKGLKLFDFSSLLSIVEDPFNNRRNEPDFALSAAIARAAKLLGFDQALSWAVEQLEKMWSNKITDVESGPLEPAQEALELSRIVDIPSIRKRAFYELMRMPSFGQSEAISSLSVADYKVLTYAREKMAQHWSDVINKSPTGRAECCIKNPSKCSIKKDNAMTRNYRWWAVVHRENLLQHHLLDPLGGYLRLKILLPLEAAKDPAVWCSHCCEEGLDRRSGRPLERPRRVVGASVIEMPFIITHTRPETLLPIN
ncbi:hypothetical protein PENSPDRAFT_131254 [Peniophora sp. CONT]|nr:hypothetical protein PENSPDRAFT_131254 [Peniophora sp. CONT]